MSEKLNTTITKAAIALWEKKDPIEELKAIGFRDATEVEFKKEDICLLIYPEESEIAFGMVSKVEEKHVTFIYYEQIRSGESAERVQIPRKLFLALKIEPEYEECC